MVVDKVSWFSVVKAEDVTLRESDTSLGDNQIKLKLSIDSGSRQADEGRDDLSLRALATITLERTGSTKWQIGFLLA